MAFSSLYIHIPFCTHRCGYCDFNTYAGLERLIPDYAKAVCDEIEYLSSASTGDLSFHTIYFGGGTPSLMPAQYLERILQTIRAEFQIIQPTEITIEANPGTLSKEYLQAIHEMGVNRISLGMQSALPKELELLERQHTYEDVREAVEWTRSADIENLNLDLIFGLPDQLLPDWLQSLQAAISLHPEHLSLYALTLEHGTPLQRKVERGLISEPDADRAADMYEVASDILSSAGYVQYEISNWALKDGWGKLYSCTHNLQYWRNLPYTGIGAGAHGFMNHVRTENILSPIAYIHRMENTGEPGLVDDHFPRTPATDTTHSIDQDTEIGETMMMGLRLVDEGVSAAEFKSRFGITLQERFPAQIARLVSVGLLEWTEPPDTRLRLTRRGYLLGNQVFREFI